MSLLLLMFWVFVIFLILPVAISFNLNVPRGAGFTIATARASDKIRQSMSVYKQENYYINGNMDSLNSLAYLNNKDQVLVLLCGIAGSGKSTYARKFIGNLPAEYRKKWTVSNQDALGNRQKVLSHARTALLAKKSVIIDRCNFDVEQRAHWVTLAQLFNISTVLCLVMPDYQNTKLCAMRAEERGNSDGIHGDDINWKGVCIQQSRSFQYPTLQEGYSGLFVCTTQQDLECFANTFKDIGERS